MSNENRLKQSFALGAKGYRPLLIILGISIFANVILGSVFAWTVVYAPQPQYYATTIRGRITPLVPLDEPNMPPSTLLQWASLAAVAANTYDFFDYAKEINALVQYFNAAGWDQFINVWNNSQNLQDLIKNKLVVSAVTSGAPIILAQGVMNGIYTWQVQIPVLITYQSASESRQQRIVVNMTIERVSTLRSGRGIGIASFKVGSK